MATFIPHKDRLYNSIRDLQDFIWILKKEPKVNQENVSRLSSLVGYLKWEADRLCK